MLAVLAAFFCRLFFAAAKKSRCRPAQGRRLKHESKARMPAQKPKYQTATYKPKTQTHHPASQTKKITSVVQTSLLIRSPSLRPTPDTINSPLSDSDKPILIPIGNKHTALTG